VSAEPAQLGELAAICHICREIVTVMATGSRIERVNGDLCLVVTLDSPSIEGHMLTHEIEGLLQP
jgi:hypothetical protein